MTLRLQAYCGAKLQSKYDVKIGDLENITAGWESEIYAFALEHGRQSKRIRSSKVVALTASVMSEEVARLKKSGFDGAIAKPLNIEVFPDLIAKIMKGESVWYIV